MLAPNFSTVPAELTSLNRWLVWRGAKIPYCASVPSMKASSTDPETWGSFEQARTTYEDGGFTGIGIALNGDGLVGVDLDKCVTDSKPSAGALSILDRIGCGYVEFSPSGTGLRGFGYGPTIKGTRGKLGDVNVELYSTGRYLTVTGHLLRDGQVKALPGFAEMAEEIKAPPISQAIDTYREHRDDSSHISVLSVLSVGDAIARTMPKSAGERNRCLFELARLVRASWPDATAQELRSIAEQWHDSALPTIGTKEFLTTWHDFSRGLESVRYPAGTTLRQIIGEIDMGAPIPDSIVSLGYSTKAIQLFRICQRLQEQAGNEPFFLSSRQAGELLELHYTDAAKMLWALKTDGVINEISKGAGNKASRYRLALAA